MGHPSKFQRVSRLVFVTTPTSLNRGQPNFARCLAVSWADTLYIHFWRLLPPNRILPGAKFTLRPSLAFCYIGSITARHSSSGCQPNFAAFSRGRHLYSAGRPSRWASAYIVVGLRFGLRAFVASSRRKGPFPSLRYFFACLGQFVFVPVSLVVGTSATGLTWWHKTAVQLLVGSPLRND